MPFMLRFLAAICTLVDMGLKLFNLEGDCNENYDPGLKTGPLIKIHNFGPIVIELFQND